MLKKGISYYKMRKLNNRRIIKNTNFKHAKSILFFCENFDDTKYKEILLFVKKIKKENSTLLHSILFCINENKPIIDLSFPENDDFNDICCIYKNEIGLRSRIKNKKVEKLLTKKFDIFYTVDSNISTIFKGLIARINSPFKIGLKSDFNNEFCDFIFDSNDSISVLEQLNLIKKYIDLMKND